MFTVDAFTGKPFSGNPAAVCLADGVNDSTWMADVAREMNLSETAFVSRRDDGGYDLRWFTPAIEVDLCGHATLASAHVLWEEQIVPHDDPIVFHTRSGPLTCRYLHAGRIEMDFPVCPVTEATPPPGFLDALGADPKFVGSSVVGYIVELPTESDVRALRPDFAAMGNMAQDSWACVTAPAEVGGFDFVSRYFAPQGGVDEDPVTGSGVPCVSVLRARWRRVRRARRRSREARGPGRHRVARRAHRFSGLTSFRSARTRPRV